MSTYLVEFPRRPPSQSRALWLAHPCGTGLLGSGTTMMLPRSLVAWHLLRRGAGLWLLVRLGMAGALLVAAAISGGDASELAAAMPAAIAVAVALGFVEARRLSERVLLANLGVSLPTQAAVLALGGTLGECTLALLRWLA